MRVDIFHPLTSETPSSTILSDCIVVDKNNWRCKGIRESLGKSVLSFGRDGASYAIDGIAYHDEIGEFGSQYYKDMKFKYLCEYRELGLGMLRLQRETRNY